MQKDPSQLHGFDRGTAPFHTNGNDAFCFSVTEERLPIFRSHCQVVHSCISLHAFVWGTGNDCWQHNGSMRIQYKSLIMPESWTAALKCTHHSAGTTASAESRPCELFWLHFRVCLLMGKIVNISNQIFLLEVQVCMQRHVHKWDQIIFQPRHSVWAVSSFLNLFLVFSISPHKKKKKNQDNC